MTQPGRDVTADHEPGESTLAERLQAARTLFAEGGLAPLEGHAFRWRRAIATAPTATDAERALVFEAMGWEALSRPLHGWAWVLLKTAHELAGPHAPDAITAAIEALGQGPLRPYEDDAELLTDVARWAGVRLAQVHTALRRRQKALRQGGSADAAPCDPLDDPAMDLRHCWFFRLERSAGTGRLRVLALAARLGLTSDDLAWLLILKAIDDDIALGQLRRQWFGEEDVFTVGLVLELLSDNADERARLLSRLDVRAPLVQHRLVYLNPPKSRPNTGRVNCAPELDESVHAWVDDRPFHPEGLDLVLQWHSPTEGTAESFFASRLDRLDRVVATAVQPSFVGICGPSIETGRAAALTWCARHDRRLLQVDVHWLLKDPATLERVLRLVVREARLRDGLVLLNGDRKWDGSDPAHTAVCDAIVRCAAFATQPILLDCELEGNDFIRRHLAPLFELRILPPTLDEQVTLWTEAMVAARLEPFSDDRIRRSVCDMALNVEDIFRAVRLARDQAWLGADSPAEGPEHEVQVTSVAPEAIRAMASSKLNEGLHDIAERIETRLFWQDVVLPENVLGKLMEIITYARYRRQVFEDWGFGAKVPYGRANSSLFTGPPGTGKTMVAGIIARELGMDLFRIEVSQIVSKWVGETEKNLGRVFDIASRGHAVLLFDEADSLFGKRTSVNSAQDRYSNLEVNYLLQRIESFDGVTILTSNFAENIDEAFARRIKFKIEFPFPEADERARIWQVCLPDGTMVAPGIDFERLGKAFELSGGHIKNAVLRGAFKAAEQGIPIDGVVLEEVGISECQDLGKLLRVRDGRVVLTEARKDS